MSKDVLVAVRPDSTIDFEFKGVTFEIGIVPQHVYGKWIEIAAKYQSGKIKGEDLLEAQKEIVRYAVKGHRDFKYSSGEEVPFKTSKANVRGKNYAVVADETLEIYFSTKIITELATEIMNGADSK
jgi:hypothetical protein